MAQSFYQRVKKILMMDREDLQQRLNQLVENIGSIKGYTQLMNYSHFESNEQVKEVVYALLQEIGQIADEIQLEYGNDLEIDIDLKSLAAFKNARFNQEIEMDHHHVWSIIKNDFTTIGDEIEQSVYY